MRIELDEDLGGTPEVVTRTEAVGFSRRTVATQCETFSLPFLRCDVFGGAAGTVSGTSVDLTASLGGGQFAAALQPGLAYYVEVVSGDHEGHRFELDEAACTATALVIEAGHPRNTLPALPTSLTGDSLAVRAHATLDQAFNKSLLTATLDPATADRVQFFDGSGFSSFWLFANGGSPRWVRMGDATLADQGTRVVAPGEGAFIRLKGAAANLIWSGYVRSNAFAQPYTAGNHFVGGGWPLTQSPLSRGMTTANGFNGSTNPVAADKLQLWQGDAVANASGYHGYFLLRGGALNHWTAEQNASLTNHNETPLLQTLRAVFLRSRQGNGNYVAPLPWTP